MAIVYFERETNTLVSNTSSSQVFLLFDVLSDFNNISIIPSEVCF